MGLDLRSALEVEQAEGRFLTSLGFTFPHLLFVLQFFSSIYSPYGLSSRSAESQSPRFETVSDRIVLVFALAAPEVYCLVTHLGNPSISQRKEL